MIVPPGAHTRAYTSGLKQSAAYDRLDLAQTDPVPDRVMDFANGKPLKQSFREERPPPPGQPPYITGSLGYHWPRKQGRVKYLPPFPRPQFVDFALGLRPSGAGIICLTYLSCVQAASCLWAQSPSPYGKFMAIARTAL